MSRPNVEMWTLMVKEGREHFYKPAPFVTYWTHRDYTPREASKLAHESARHLTTRWRKYKAVRYAPVRRRKEGK
jgi:hypothetical protein